MKEIEAKILEIDSADIQKRLINLGAKKVFDGNLEWVVFDFSDGSLSKREILLRLRTSGQETKLTLKKLLNSEESKVSEETELAVSNFKTAMDVLEGIGLKVKKGYPLKKHRISYLLENTHFEIDTLPQFPTYLEIEAPSSEIIKEYVKKLGFSVNDIKPWGTREVFAHYRSAK